jgi:hypothetical protein
MNVVTDLSGKSCDLGPLTFSNFEVSVVGLSAALYLGQFTKMIGDEVDLEVQIITDPGVATAPADVLLFYTVSSRNGAAGIAGVDLGNGGFRTTIQEMVCASPFVTNGCSDAQPLANFAVGPGGYKAVTFAPQSTIYVKKDIAIGTEGFVSDFTNSHLWVPEPLTLGLTGIGLTLLGTLRRRRV